MKYIFKYKRNILWKKIKASGHKGHAELDRMDVFLEDGSIYSIGKWSECDLILGIDWVIAIKKSMEAESGQNIKLTV